MDSLDKSIEVASGELPPFEDPRVQVVYELLADPDNCPPNIDEHWEGYLARRIVQALYDAPPQSDGVKHD